MEQTIAQSAPNNDASRAEDFQPSTRNPQGNVSNVQQQGGLQNVTNPQEFLDQNKTVELSIAAEPAPMPAQSSSNNITTLVIIASVAVVLAILLFKISNKLPEKKSAVTTKKDQPKQTEETSTAVTSKKPEVKTKTKVKKTKRRNR